MIYLILDTNIWLYMANGFDSISGKFSIESDQHIHVFEQIKSKTEIGEFKILVNEIILNEWARNKAVAFQHIKELEKCQKEKIAELVKQKDEFDPKLFVLKCAEIHNKFNAKIELNKQHIEAVEEFIQSCEVISIPDSIKLEVIDLAIRKEKAPFLTDKNNCADASILFGAIHFLKENMRDHIEKAVFVSNNYKEYGESKESNNFHSDIQERIGSLSLSFHRHFINLLGLTEDLQYEIDVFHEYIRDNHQYFYCLSPFCESRDDFYGFGYLDKKILVANSKPWFDPNQLSLFHDEPISNSTNIRFVNLGVCVICSSHHVECPDCDSLLLDVNDSDQFYCQECESYYEIGIVKTEKVIYLIKEGDVHL